MLGAPSDARGPAVLSQPTVVTMAARHASRHSDTDRP
jgi:hypothetical protein